MMVVAALYKLARIDGKFTKEHKTLERSRCVVSEDYVNTINDNYLSTGKLYIVDEKATNTYWGKNEEPKKKGNKTSEETKTE
jgi:hypothetical protein